MVKFRQLHSVLHKDGKNHPVDLITWGNMTQTGATKPEWDAFRESFEQYHRVLLDKGELIVNDITEEFVINGAPYKIIVGREYIRNENFTHCPGQMEWEQIRASDPNVTFHSEEPIV